jgi:ABC-type Co2+ transport system permease subunit
MHSATLKYDERLVNRAVRSYWRRSLGLSVLVGVPLICIVLAIQVASGDRSWYMGLLAGAAILGVGMPILVYWVHYRNSMAKLRDMKQPVATLIADEESFTLASDHGSSTLKWEAIKEIWGFEGFWLLLFSKAHFATIPLEGLSQEMREYILEKVKRGGGRVAV